jgi:hypothetical protein
VDLRAYHDVRRRPGEPTFIAQSGSGGVYSAGFIFRDAKIDQALLAEGSLSSGAPQGATSTVVRW